jgi:hypothetical protein
MTVYVVWKYGREPSDLRCKVIMAFTDREKAYDFVQELGRREGPDWSFIATAVKVID